MFWSGGAEIVSGSLPRVVGALFELHLLSVNVQGSGRHPSEGHRCYVPSDPSEAPSVSGFLCLGGILSIALLSL